MAAVLLLLPLSVAVGQVGDTVFIVKDDVAPSNIDVALAVVAETPFDSVETVVVSRDDEFADALSSGLLQDGAPLILVPSTGTLPPQVIETLVGLSPARAIILGGEAAVASEVAAQIGGLGMSVERRAGASRFETAIAVAATDAPDADTVILARAFAADGAADPTQAFADTLAAGGLSARTGWPILLTESHVLTTPTREYLAASTASNVVVVGGAAAVSEAVLAEAAAVVGSGRRVAGASRAGTAVAVAKEAGDETAADAARVILTDGQTDSAWAAGFALASHAAFYDAPILLSVGDTLPSETESFLAGGIGGNQSGPVLTCTFDNAVCERARTTAGLPPATSGLAGDLAPVAMAFIPGGVDEVSFDAAAGDVVRLVTTDTIPTVGVEELCVRFRLIDPFNAVEHETFSDACVGPGEGAAFGPHTLERTGTYRYEIRESGGITSGTLTALVNAQQLVTGTLEAAPASLDLSRPGDIIRMPFAATTGSTYRLGLTAAMPTTGVEELCVRFRLIDPFGNIEEQTFSDSCHAPGGGSVFGPHTATRTGTYIYEVRGESNTTGTLTAYTNAAEHVPAADGTDAVLNLSRPGDVVRLAVAASAGDIYRLGLADAVPAAGVEELCVRFRLIDPFGNVEEQTFSNSCHTPEGSSAFGPHTLARDGTYIYEVRTESNTTGTIVAYLNAAEHIPAGGGADVLVDLSRPGDVVRLTVAATAGNTYRLGLSDAAPSAGVEELCMRLRLIDPFGNVEDQTFSSTCHVPGGGSSYGPHTVTRTGTYSYEIRVEPTTTGTIVARVTAV